MNAGLLREAWRLWRSPSSSDTYIAVLLVGIVVAPIVWQRWSHRSTFKYPEVDMESRNYTT